MTISTDNTHIVFSPKTLEQLPPTPAPIENIDTLGFAVETFVDPVPTRF